MTTGSTVYIAGAGPVGLAAAHAAQLLGAAVVIVGDMNADRLKQARSFGCETVDLSQDAPLADQIEQIVGERMVDCAVDAVGFEAKGHGHGAEEAPATVLNSIMEVTREAGKLGILGLYVTGDPGAKDEAAKQGSLSIRIGLGWAKSHSFTTGQCPVMRYHRQLMNAILNDRCQIAKAVNATVISLDEAPQGYQDFDGERQEVRPRPARDARRQAAHRRIGSPRRPADAGGGARTLRRRSRTKSAQGAVPAVSQPAGAEPLGRWGTGRLHARRAKALGERQPPYLRQGSTSPRRIA